MKNTHTVGDPKQEALTQCWLDAGYRVNALCLLGYGTGVSTQQPVGTLQM